MINSTQIKISFVYNGKTETRHIDKMHIEAYHVQDFYRIRGKLKNFDVYEKDGIWKNMLPTGLAFELLQIVGEAIKEAEK